MKWQVFFLVISIGLVYKAFSQPNDNCANPILLEVGEQCTPGNYSNIGATAEPVSIAPDPSCGSYTGADVWFKFEMPASGALRIELSNYQGATVPSFTLYTGNCSNFSEVVCVRNDRNKTIYHPEFAGEILYIRVYSYFKLPEVDFSICVFEPEIPPNDLCQNARLLEVGANCELEFFSSEYATSEYAAIAANPTCGHYQGGDVWFKTVMPASGVLRIIKNRVTGATHPPMTVYSGSCGNFTEVFCSSNDPTETLNNPSLIGQTIYLRFYGYNDEEGSTFSLCLYEEETPVNDDCEEAINLSVGSNCEIANYSNIQATAQSSATAPLPTCGAYQGADVWFKLIVPASGNIRLEASVASGPTPPSITLYSGSCGNFEEVGCMSNDSGQSFNFPALAGGLLFLRVFTFNSDDGGVFSLCVFEPSVPLNSRCENAIIIPVGKTCPIVHYSNAFATQQQDETAPAPSCGQFSGGDVWFKAEVPASGKLRIHTERLEGATYKSFTVYSGVCGGFTEIACGQQTPYLFIDQPDLVGEIVYIQIFNYASEEGGTFGLCLQEFYCTTDTIDVGEVTLCKGESYTFGTQILTEPGEYKELFQSSQGCDSLVNISVAVNDINTEIVQNGYTLTAQSDGAIYQWIECTNEATPISGKNGQNFTATSDGNYAVIITKNSCADTSACYSLQVLGILEEVPVKLKVYPNPVENLLNISLPESREFMSIEIVNSMGHRFRKEYFQGIKTASIQLNTVPPGTYFLKISTNKEVFREKMIKN